MSQGWVEQGGGQMYQTLILLGITCVIGAVVGGGLTVFNVIQIPQLRKFQVAAVFGIGVVLVLAGIAVRPKPPPPGPTGISVITDPVGPQTALSCPVNVRITGHITTTGGEGSVVVRLTLVLNNGNTIHSPQETVAVHGANTYPIFDTWLFPGPSGGDFDWEIVSPGTQGSEVQPFSVTC